jgi:hypothetical protein
LRTPKVPRSACTPSLGAYVTLVVVCSLNCEHPVRARAAATATMANERNGWRSGTSAPQAGAPGSDPALGKVTLAARGATGVKRT